jgi:hypothetical protein
MGLHRPVELAGIIGMWLFAQLPAWLDVHQPSGNLASVIVVVS